MNYRKHVLRTFSGGEIINNAEDMKNKLSLGALGLAGETGEVVDIIKKALFHNKPLDLEKLKLELGDVRWYLEVLCIVTGFTMEQVEAANVAKLEKRFPNGFKPEDANAKADELVPEHMPSIAINECARCGHLLWDHSATLGCLIQGCHSGCDRFIETSNL